MEEHSDKTAPGLTPRLIAAGWFAVAALIAALLALVPFMLASAQRAQGGVGALSVLAIVALPVTVASFFGFAVGSRILDAERPRSAWRSMGIGMLVAILSYLAMPLVQFGAVMIFGTRNPMLVTTKQTLLLILFTWGIGLILVGWLIVIVGGLAGFLLFKLSLTDAVQLKLSQSRPLDKRQALVLVAGAACVVIILTALISSVSIWSNFFNAYKVE